MEKYLDGQLNLLVLISAFVIAESFRRTSLMLDLCNQLFSMVKSKKLSLALMSFFAGILPIEGRVTVSAPILNSVLNHKGDDCECSSHRTTRGRMGILDYVANHHYYLWSPLEKTVVLLMGGLGMTYLQVITLNAIPLIAYFIFMVSYIYFKVDESEIILAEPAADYSSRELFLITPFVGGIIASMVVEPYYAFPFVAFFYALIGRISPAQAFRSVNWKVIGLVALVILIGNIAKGYNKELTAAMQYLLGDGADITAIMFALAAGALASFVMGSSGKYAAITVVLGTVLGTKWLPLIIATQYAAYLVSPTHKCGAISAGYFGTSLLEFYKVIGALALLMVFIGALMTSSMLTLM